MNILVVSDTHGKIERAIEIYHRIHKGCRIDYLVHCGDLVSDAYDLEKQLYVETIAVPGNCDGCHNRNFRIIDTPAGRLLITHGHAEGVKTSLDRLHYLALENDCRMVCFGHTHCALNREIDGIRFLNPGSLTNPRDGSNGSAALLVAEKNSVAATILSY